MQLIKTSRTFINQRIRNLLASSVRVSSAFSFSLAALFAILIWFGGPHLAWDDYAPLANTPKRLYVIFAVFLVWLLKYLIIDLDTPSPDQYKDPLLVKQLLKLQKKLRGALAFLRKTVIERRGKRLKLNQLPWFLLIGPPHAGKTSLLTKADVNFILQRQYLQQRLNPSQTSEHCDFWITREASIIDIPSRYLQVTPNTKKPALWDYFLRLVKDQRGENSINGLIVALPLPELLHDNDPKQLHATIQRLCNRIHEFQQYFADKIPCYLLVTKCDLLPGFKHYFAESGQDEIAQPWGITLPSLDKTDDLFEASTIRLNALIKKLNEQLIWRLHQERDPMARPYIKDFPLQVERVKELVLTFVRKYSDEALTPYLRGIYFTSALQVPPESETTTLENDGATTNEIQLFKKPAATSQAYFIKQFILQALAIPEERVILKLSPALWKRYIAYAASIFVIAIVGVVLGKDFNQGLKQTYAIKQDFSHYKIAISEFHEPSQHLQKTLQLLNQLAENDAKKRNKKPLQRFINYYSNHSIDKAQLIYQRALQDILLPEIRDYLQSNLEKPINREPMALYQSLKAYVMLSNPKYVDRDFLLNTLNVSIGDKLADTDKTKLLAHVKSALLSMRHGQILNQTLVRDARNYLFSMRPTDLAFILLKSQPATHEFNNISLAPLTLEQSTHSSAKQQIIPGIFTAKAFKTTFSNAITAAATQALHGNWVLGVNTKNQDTISVEKLIEELRIHYINQYASAWESLLKDINSPSTRNLHDVDQLITDIAARQSPIESLLSIIHENTYFEPIASASEKLLNLGRMLEEHQHDNITLSDIQKSLNALHLYLKPVLAAENTSKAAFELVANRMNADQQPDAITNVRLLATKSPEPIKGWLEKITDDAWQYLVTDATHYLDMSWQNDVSKRYQESIKGRYPFNSKANQDVSLANFIKFFGKPGILTNFYHHYLEAFIDTSKPVWRWKPLDNSKLPFSDESLTQIQQAMRIHQAFFPKDDDIPSVQFTLQAHQLNQDIHAVNLAIDGLAFTDTKASQIKHTVAWPNMVRQPTGTRLTFTLNNKQVITKHYPGDWGWFKLISHSFESAASKKQILVNFAEKGLSAKYLVITDDHFNPFMTMNLNHFDLPEKLE